MGILAASRERLRLSRQRRRLQQEPRPHGFAELARAYLALGDRRAAAAVFASGRSLFPEAEELRRLGVLFAAQEDCERLRHAKERAAGQPSAQSFLEWADAYRALGQGRRCREVLVELLARFGEHCTALTVLGEMRFAGYLDTLAPVDALEAEALLGRAVAADREALKPRFLLADLYYRVGAYHAAEKLARELVALTADHERAQRLLDEIGRRPRGAGPEDFRSQLAAVEDRMALAEPAPPWERQRDRAGGESLPEVDPATEMAHLVEGLGARGAALSRREVGTVVAAGDAGTAFANAASRVMTVCQRAARGMELGLASRLVVEGDGGAAVVEGKGDLLLAAVLPASADVRQAAVATRDAIERLAGGRR